jgi:serine/threonine protein phosphatase PrpC
MRLSSFAGSDVGRARSGNEDSYFCGRAVFAVADGLGGHQGGEVASAAAVAPLAALDGRDLATPTEAAEALAAAIQEANSGILERAAGDPSLWGMGTTMTAAAVTADGHLQLAHVGDSRAYLLRDGALEQLTTDHTVVAELVRRGRLTPELAAIHPERSILTRAVGLDPRVPVDTPDPLDLRPGDQYLLCSDGLTEAVPDATIAELLSAGVAGGEETCRSLIDAANEAGGPDNITVVLVRVGE